MIKEILDIKTDKRVSSGKFSISSIGCCWRKKYMELKNLYFEDFDEMTARTFMIGNTVHQEVVQEIVKKGHAANVHVCAVEVQVPLHPFLSGRIDLIISDGIKNYILDIKSASKYTLDQLKIGICPENYKHQVLLYEHLTGFHDGILLFVGKDRGELIEVPVIYNKEEAEKLISEIENFMTEYVEKNIMPPKCDGGVFGCKCCYPTGDSK